LKVVVKIGGHLFPSCLIKDKIRVFIETLRQLKREGHSLVVVTGGGKEARKYIEAARALGGSETTCDLIGIMVTRINARILISGLGTDAYLEPPTDLEEVRKAFETGKIVVLGGLQPGQSTNAVGILSAEAVGADLFINATDVDGVYTEDPKRVSEAKKLDIIEVDELLKIVVEGELQAGSYKLFDLLAVKTVKRSGIKTVIIDGRVPENIERIINGEKIGTMVRV
jgi:uridylate kinase